MTHSPRYKADLGLIRWKMLGVCNHTLLESAASSQDQNEVQRKIHMQAMFGIKIHYDMGC